MIVSWLSWRGMIESLTLERWDSMNKVKNEKEFTDFMNRARRLVFLAA